MYINSHETRLTSYQRHGLAIFIKLSHRSLTHFFEATVLMAKSKYAYSAYGTFSEWTRYMYVLPASIPLFTSRIFSSTLSPMSGRKYNIFFTCQIIAVAISSIKKMLWRQTQQKEDFLREIDTTYKLHVFKNLNQCLT